MTSLALWVTHSNDLCHNPHIISERLRRKGDVKGHFPSPVCTFKEQRRIKKSSGERERESRPFVARQCEKAQPCKISVEVGGGPQRQCAFFHRWNLKHIHCPSCVPNTHSGVCPLFMVQTEAGKGMWLWSRRHEMSHRKTMTRMFCVCASLAKELSLSLYRFLTTYLNKR